jgi:hypothetical protein
MAIQDRGTLKGYFEDGDIPTGAQFGDLIDSTANLAATAVNTFGGDVTVDGDLVISTGSVAADITNLASASGDWNDTTTTVNTASAEWSNIYHLLTFVDHSVNLAKTFIDHEGSLVLESSYANPSLAGNFNGGGTGSKPIASIGGFDGLPLSGFPVIDSEVELRTDETVTDPEEDALGVSYNCLVDLAASGVGFGPFIVCSITATLNGVVDKYAETGASASITDFNINTVTVADKLLYVVGNLPNYTGALAWAANPIDLATIISGGVDYTGSYPDAVLVSMISQDGGHPAGTKLAAIQAQLGDSGNDYRVVTAITELSLDGVQLLPIT